MLFDERDTSDGPRIAPDEERNCGISFQLVHSDSFVKHRYYDDKSYKLCTLRYPIVESFRKGRLQESHMFISPLDLCSYDGEDVSLRAEGRMYDLSINQRYAGRHGIDTMLNGSMYPYLGEMCHHGYPLSPQWDGELELDSANDCDDLTKFSDVCAFSFLTQKKEDYRLVARDCATENALKNICVARETLSLWNFIRDSLNPPDVLFLTTGSKWNNAKLHGEFEAF